MSLITYTETTNFRRHQNARNELSDDRETLFGIRVKDHKTIYVIYRRSYYLRNLAPSRAQFQWTSSQRSIYIHDSTSFGAETIGQRIKEFYGD